MKTSDAIKYFGSRSRLARLLGISRQAVSRWGDEVPQRWQYHLERLSAGELVPNVPLPNYAIMPEEHVA